MQAPQGNGEHLIDRAGAALGEARRFAAEVRTHVRDLVGDGNGVDLARLDQNQHVAHGLAWIETIVAALAALLGWGAAGRQRGEFGRAEQLVVALGFGEYLAQLAGGLAIGPNEFVRPGEMGLEQSARRMADHPAASSLIAGADPARRAELVDWLARGGTIAEGLGDPLTDQIRAQFRRFTAERITPRAHRWHLDNALIPDALIAELAALGTFGICIAPQYGGLGLGRLEMCIVTEELSRGWIAAGSLGTRSEIAGELIMLAGTDEQKARLLPPIASGEMLPTAVFTEPGHGSDLAGITTRATRREDGGWRIDGAKSWITHASRSDLMTLLARTGGMGHRGLSLFLATKPRGTNVDPFPAAGMSGSEIAVLGYRGMREYELAFDGFTAGPDSLLGGVEGAGFRHLMQTFEAARIQTAARSVGVAWRAFDLALGYASDRHQFGRALITFPRIADKLAAMLVETIAARELTHEAARARDSGRRCDVEAGMAKLLAARVAWTSADSALQIHGGNGYALESEVSRILCDARILSIFEGTAEIQAQIIARGVLERGN